MCSVFDVDDDAGIERFLQEYGVRHSERMIFGRRRRPTQQVSIVTARHGAAEVENAIWHLYLERDGENWINGPNIVNPAASFPPPPGWKVCTARIPLNLAMANLFSFAACIRHGATC